MPFSARLEMEVFAKTKSHFDRLVQGRPTKEHVIRTINYLRSAMRWYVEGKVL